MEEKDPRPNTPILHTPTGEMLLRQAFDILRILTDSVSDGAPVLPLVVRKPTIRETRAAGSPHPLSDGQPAQDGQGVGDDARDGYRQILSTREPRRFKEKRRLVPRVAYTAKKAGSKQDLRNLTPSQATVLNVLANARKPQTVPDLMAATDLAQKTVENASSKLFLAGFLEKHTPR